ncbi:hypothetical protein MWH28_09360 [Natroniella sulfidigena]|uniref:hypothetical protein n=1 Tax=Natroniella sulfidigena TaxID=723921 RepID=UPI00200B25C4|nr:hypothetical protein [Natroniella sulfidigena]MCK8817563.1 hypothetical protein [Natroniella sulfidigena]
MFSKLKVYFYKVIKLLWVLPFIGLSFFLGIWSWNLYLIDYNSDLISIGLTIAIFAVNFSFLEYQFSPYRALLESITQVQIITSGLLLLLAISPLIVLIINSSLVAPIALIMIPLIACASILLTKVSRYESNPIVMLNRTCSKKKVDNFLERYSQDIDNHLQEIKRLELSQGGDIPEHEWSERVLPHFHKDDPFNILASLGRLAIENSDVHTFGRVIERSLEAGKWIENKRLVESVSPAYKVKSLLLRHAQQNILRLAIASYELDKSNIFAIKFLEVADLFIKREAARLNQTSRLFKAVLNKMVIVAKNLLQEQDDDSALIPIIVVRQAVQKGLDNPSEEPLFDAKLGNLTHFIKEMGQQAVTARNTEYLYRCLDALSWLGCSAIKRDNYEVGRLCLQGLVQLGRESRAEELECFWTMCVLQPVDHVYKKLKLISTRVPSLAEAKAREKWLKLISTAFSMLCGTKHTVSITDIENKEIIIEDSKEPYKISITKEGRSRTIDFSNYQFTQEYELR